MQPLLASPAAAPAEPPLAKLSNKPCPAAWRLPPALPPMPSLPAACRGLTMPTAGPLAPGTPAGLVAEPAAPDNPPPDVDVCAAALAQIDGRKPQCGPTAACSASHSGPIAPLKSAYSCTLLLLALLPLVLPPGCLLVVQQAVGQVMSST